MSVSSLIRWGGPAAVVAGALYVIISLTTLLVLGFSPEKVISFNLLVRSAIAPVGGVLLLLGLVGLYFRQSEATGVLGLIGFLCAFFGTVLMQAGNTWAGWLTWAWLCSESLSYEHKRTRAWPPYS
jgi:hypothetical protein